MILTEHTVLVQETHIVIPIGRAHSQLRRYMSLIQVDIAESAHTSHYLLYPFPNTCNRFSSWEYTTVSNLSSVPFRQIEKIFKVHTHSSVPIKSPQTFSIYASISELLLRFPWHTTENSKDLLEFIQSQYGSNYAFAVVHIDAPGRYLFGWYWSGDMPFIAAQVHYKPQHSLLAIIVNAQHLDWIHSKTLLNESLIQYVCTDSNVLHLIYTSLKREYQQDSFHCFVGAYIAPHLYAGDITSNVIPAYDARNTKQQQPCIIM